jgi:hypothetical protein
MAVERCRSYGPLLQDRPGPSRTRATTEPISEFVADTAIVSQ